ncbi:BCCT family transporter, partial [Acinetobacter baumannii]
HVLCFLDTRSDKDTPIRIRLIWSVFITLISAGLLYVGGLKTIQTAIVLFGFPMVILLTIICVTLFKALHQEDISTINIVPK